MNCSTHEKHDHIHGPNCGHPAVKHLDHVDYLHEGHLHHLHQGHIDEHELEASEKNPTTCSPVACGVDHANSEKIPHAGHFDYLVNGRLHHAHDGHCDDHGPIALATN